MGRRSKNIAILAMVCTLVLGGCNNFLGHSSEVKNDSIEIVLAHFQGEGDAMYNSIQKAILNFELDNPGVTIRQEYYPADAYLTQAEQWNEDREVRDMTLVSGTMAKTFSENETILDLTELVEEYGILRKIRVESFREVSVNGKHYAVPWEKADYGFIMYNKGIFEELGIEKFPETLEELMSVAQIIKEAGYIPMAMGNKLLWPADSLLFSAFVNNFVDKEWYENILLKNGKANFTDIEFVEALTAFQELALCGMFNENFASIDNEQRGELYQNREAAMISAGNWECRSTSELAPEVAEETEIALWPRPEKNSTKQESIVSSSAWGIAISSNANEEKQKYAMEFITDYVCSQDFARVMAEEQGVFTPWDAKYDVSTINSITQKQQAILANNNVVNCLNWDSTLPSDVKLVYQQGLQEMLQGEITPSTLAEEMQSVYIKP